MSPEGVARLLTPLVETESFGYAMGWRVGSIRGERAFHHGGVLYDFRGKMIVLPERQQGVVVLTNASSVFGRPTSHRVANGVVALLVGKRPAPGPVPLGWLLTGLAIIMGLLTYGLLKEAWTTRRWLRVAVEVARGGGPKAWRPWLAVAWGVSVPPSLIIGLLIVFEASWSQLVRAMPDLSVWILVVAPLSWGLGLFKGASLWRGARR